MTLRFRISSWNVLKYYVVCIAQLADLPPPPKTTGLLLKQDFSGSMHLMQCSVLKLEMSLDVVVKRETSDAAESAQVMADVLRDALSSYLR